MSKAIQNRLYISPHIRLDFLNHSNLKQDIQNRQSDDIEMKFFRALQNIQGDNKETKGENLSEIVKLGMAYFFECIYPKKTPIKDSHYSVNAIKGFFDACNLSPYTAIYEVDTTYYKLRETVLFKACYLIIQCAWFFNSEHFGSHQYLDYTSHYIQTGNKLPIDNYNYDKENILRKYARIDEKRNSKYHPKGEPSFLFVEKWYFYILYMLCRELELPTKHFKIAEKDFREYNPLTKCPKILRAETPFKIIECDIKSAFPSFLDLQTGSNIKNEIYNNLMQRKNITRSQAKVLFNSVLNSGKYKTKEQIKIFLIECGYSISQAEEITFYTNGRTKFITHMCDLEKDAIEGFKKINNLKTSTRLHDSLLFIDSGIKLFELKAENEIIEFGKKVLKKPVISNTYGFSDKHLPYAYVSSLPSATNDEFKSLIRKQILTTPELLGEDNGFRFFKEKYDYISASFDLNYKYNFEEFMYNCKEMISTLKYLNGKPISNIQLFLILYHIRRNSNIIFNLRFLYKELRKHINSNEDIIFRNRDYIITEKRTFKTKIDFLIALNIARGEVNKKARLQHLYLLMKKRYASDDFSFIDLKMKGKVKSNDLMKFMLLRINELCTGRIRKPKAQSFNSNPLKSINYKEGWSYDFEPNKFSNSTRLIQRKIQKYEKELLRINKIVNNREIAKQYLYILNEILDFESENNNQIVPKRVQAEKTYLMQQITGLKYKTIQEGEAAFNKAYLPKHKKLTENYIPRKNDFNTSLEHSAFNIEIEEANSRGEQFFKEYLQFHKLNEKEKLKIKVKKLQLNFPKLNFDE